MTAAIIIILSWWLNAVADAIDHGKGARTLYELWHIIKFFSYALPFGYIAITQHLPLWGIIATLVLMYGWEPIYGYLRRVNFCELDDRLKLPWLAWLWGIKHEDGM